MNVFKRCQQRDVPKRHDPNISDQNPLMKISPGKCRRIRICISVSSGPKNACPAVWSFQSTKSYFTSQVPCCPHTVHFPVQKMFQMAWKAVRTYCGTHHVSFNYTMQIKRYVYREQARNESPGNGLALSVCPRLFGAIGLWNLDIQ